MAEPLDRASVERELQAGLAKAIDPVVVDRIAELGATRDELQEAISVKGDAPKQDPTPSNERVAEIRALLAELLVPDDPRRPA
jgi:hypothetical protein